MPAGPTGETPVLHGPADRAGEEMPINFANVIKFRFHFGVVEAGALKCITPMIGSEEPRIRPELRIRVYFSKTIENLKDQFRIHWLIGIRPDTFADDQAAIRSKRLTSL